MLSLAGIPPLAGFFGKFYVFTAAVGAEPKELGLLWLVVLAIAMSAVSLYYYLRVLKQAYVAPGATQRPRSVLPWTDRVWLAGAALGVLLLGALPGLLLDPLARAIQASGFGRPGRGAPQTPTHLQRRESPHRRPDPSLPRLARRNPRETEGIGREATCDAVTRRNVARLAFRCGSGPLGGLARPGLHWDEEAPTVAG